MWNLIVTALTSQAHGCYQTAVFIMPGFPAGPLNCIFAEVKGQTRDSVFRVGCVSACYASHVALACRFSVYHKSAQQPR